jgi:hypothetical protein
VLVIVKRPLRHEIESKREFVAVGQVACKSLYLTSRATCAGCMAYELFTTAVIDSELYYQ